MDTLPSIVVAIFLGVGGAAFLVALGFHVCVMIGRDIEREAQADFDRAFPEADAKGK